MTDPIRKVIISLPQSYLEAIDTERGTVKRSVWLRELLRKGKLRGYGLVVPAETRGRPRKNSGLTSSDETV